MAVSLANDFAGMVYLSFPLFPTGRSSVIPAFTSTVLENYLHVRAIKVASVHMIPRKALFQRIVD